MGCNEVFFLEFQIKPGGRQVGVAENFFEFEKVHAVAVGGDGKGTAEAVETHGPDVGALAESFHRLVQTALGERTFATYPKRL